KEAWGDVSRWLGGAPPASWSAALPARPWPGSADRLPRNGGGSTSPAPFDAPSPEASHGGGADQSRGGLRWTGGCSGPGVAAGVGTRSSRASRSPPSACSAAAATAAVAAPAAAAGLAGELPLARAASRRAQSWNVGQTGKALERQYASW